MKMPFSRKQRAASIPEGVTETWSEQDNAVVIHVPINAAIPDTSLVADQISERVIATVAAVQAGLFGHSIPDGTTGAGVRIQIETGTTPLPPLAEHGVEILREHLGQSIPLTVVTEKPAPAVRAPKGKRKKAGQAAAGAAAPAAPTAPAAPASSTGDSADGVEVDEVELDEIDETLPVAVEPAPTPGLAPAAYTWDAENERLRAEILYLGAPDADAQTQVDVRTLVELTIAALAAPETRAQIPADAPAGHQVWLTVVVNEDAVGPLTEKMFDDGEDQFEGTRVDFVVMTEPREVVVGMLAER